MTGRLKPRPPGAAALVLAVLLVALVSACGSSNNQNSASKATSGTTPASTTSASELAPIHGTYAPKIDPADFVTTIDNRYFPLVPGTGFHYKGVA